MPSQPAWFHRLNEILTELRELEITHLDRLAVQRLFGVAERRARQIMAGLPGLRVGNAFAVGRQALIERMENTTAGERFQWEVSRRGRLAEELERTRRQLTARCVVIPTPADVRDRLMRDLGAGIELRSGELRIQFKGAEDLAAKLFELSQAMANDWHGFAGKIEKSPVNVPSVSL